MSMCEYNFSKYTKIILRSIPSFSLKTKDNKIEEVLSGYTTDISGFPFVIANRTENKIKYWLIINKFSGKSIVYRFKTKFQAEVFFEKFSEMYDITDIDFKNPLSSFDYKEASFKVQKTLLKRIMEKI